MAQLRLALLLIERILDGHASSPLLLSVDLGGHLPLWTFSSARLTEYKLASPQPLLAGAYAMLSHLLTQNLRRATFHPPLYLQALTLLQRLMIAQQRAGQSLPLLKWSDVWDALFSTADFLAQVTSPAQPRALAHRCPRVSRVGPCSLVLTPHTSCPSPILPQDDVLSSKGAPEVGLRVLELINVLVTLGDQIFPGATQFESFAYELVRRRRVFEKLYRLSKRIAPRLVEAMSLARSLIVAALDTIAQMEPAAAANLTSSQALDVVRGIHPTSLKPEAAAALLRPATQLSPYEQRGLAQSAGDAINADRRWDAVEPPVRQGGSGARRHLAERHCSGCVG